MKFVFLFTALFMTAQAFAVGPDDDKCNQPAQQKVLQRTIVEDLRQSAAKLDSTAFSFNFASVWRHRGTSDLIVYFEMVSSNLTERHGYSAQYSVNAKTCAPKLLKTARLYRDDEIKVLPPTTENCEDLQKFADLRKNIMTLIEDLFPKVNPGEIMGNYTFSTIERLNGTSDITVFLERTVPGLISRPSLAQFSVDPNTCKPKLEETTSITPYAGKL